MLILIEGGEGMNTNTAATESNRYLYVVDGVIPEAMPIVAYRRVGHPELAGRKLIKCPYCRELLTHVDRHTSVRIYSLSKDIHKKQIPGLFIKRCDICKNEVGVMMTVISSQLKN